MTTDTLDTRAWLLWSLACMLPLLMARNPWITLEIGLIVLTVRAVAVPRGPSARSAWLIRVAAVMALVGAIFNVLTVRSGNMVMLELPDSWPLIGGALTFNALVYGLVSGMTLFVLVLTGVTTASLIRWIDLFHLLPRRLAPIAATGSVAWAFLPQTAIAWQNIRETMSMRGMVFRGPRDYLPIVIPLLASGLERSLTMAEALEARGFGAPVGTHQGDRKHTALNWQATALVVGLAGAALAAYLLSTGALGIGLLVLTVAGCLLFLYSRFTPHDYVIGSRYRPGRTGPADRLTMIGASIAIITTFVWLWWRPASLTLTFYPSLSWPNPVPLLLLGLAPLMLPAFLITPHRGDSL
ncbi:MAG TPA: energy-coupling factor transporter transmembrane component T [Thermomicrobiales bacterium]|nr:energy-coupling factor transporter transmembrane component T [Thermomicrobiales bacterium]